MRSTCLPTALDVYSYNNCKNNDWLFDAVKSKWFLSPRAYLSGASDVSFVYSAGRVGAQATGGIEGVNPSAYLKSNVNITGGNGSEESPYTLSID